MKLKNKSLLCILICTSFPATSFSADRTWAGNQIGCNGNFESIFCWQNFEIPPNSGDTAIFSSSGSDGRAFINPVNFNDAVTTNNRVNVTANYRWQLNDNRYNISTSLNVSGSDTFLDLGTFGGGSFLVDAGVVDVAGILDITNGASVLIRSPRLVIGSLNVSSNSRLNSGGFTSMRPLSVVGGAPLVADAVRVRGNALVSGAQAVWFTTELRVEDGRFLNVSNGGFVRADNSLEITGSGRVFANNGGRIRTESLFIRSGSELFSSQGFVGRASIDPDSVSSTVDALVTGTDALWQTNTLSVTDGGRLRVENDGLVDVAGNLFIESSSKVSTLGTSGGGRIEVGRLSIFTNGELLSKAGLVGDSLLTGDDGVSSMGDAVVSGVGARWNTGTLGVRNSRTLTVANGGFVDIGTGLEIDSFGTVSTTGGGRIVASTFDITSGGQLSSSSAFVGSLSTANGSVSAVINTSLISATVNVSGTGSRWNTGTLSVKNTRSLSIASGGFVGASSSVLESAFLAVSGTGSKFDAGILDVTSGSILTVSADGFLKASSSTLSSGAIARVVGAGSTWETDTFDVMGGSNLAVAIGGLVKASSSTLSDNASSTVADVGSKWETDTFDVKTGGTLTVKDGGFVDVNGLLSIQTSAQAFSNDGGRIEADELSVAFGGQLFSNSGFVGTSIPAPGSVSSRGNAVVTGGGSQWNTGSLSVVNSSVLNVGNGGFVDVEDNLKIESSARVSTLGGSSLLGTSNGGRVEAGTLTLQNSGDLFSRSGFVGSTSTANGSVSSIGNALVTGFGSLWDSNTIEVSNNKSLSVTDTAVVDAALNIDVKSGGQLLVNDATVQTISIDVVSDGALKLKAAVINADVNITNANLAGTGVINGDVIGLGAKIGSGQSSGLLEIDGSFSQDIDSSLFFSLAGTIAESEYNVLSISGGAMLSGELVVDLFSKGGMFSPSEGDFFDILYAEKIGGKFDLLTLAALGGGLDWELNYLFDEIGSTDVVRLSVIQTSAVPVPAAAWLFGSGLLGLIGVARRK